MASDTLESFFNERQVAIVDKGHEFAIQMFGADGVRIRERVAEVVREVHNAMADAQQISGQRSSGVYGVMWRGLYERFEEFGALPHATLDRPGQAPYKVPVINGTALVAWRYGRTSDDDLFDIPFVTSDARSGMFSLSLTDTQEELDLDLPRPELTDEERELAGTVQAAFDASDARVSKVVVVAVSSSPHALHKVEWGEVVDVVDGCLRWGFHESLMGVTSAGLLPVAEKDQTFTSGKLPEKVIRLTSDDESEATNE